MYEEAIQAFIGYLVAEGAERILGKQASEDAQVLLNRIVRGLSWFVALLTSFGFSFFFNGSIQAGGTVGISFPSAYDGMMALGHFLGQGMFQEWRLSVKKRDRRLDEFIEASLAKLRSGVPQPNPMKE